MLVFKGKNPNVQAVKNKYATIKYLHKEDKEPLSKQMDLQEYINKTEKKQTILGKRLMQGEDLKALVEEEGNQHLVLKYDKLKTAIAAYHLDSKKPSTAGGCRGLWICGPSGTGKTHKARDISLSAFNEEPFILTGGKWFDGYKGQKVIVVEDLDKYIAH